MMRMVANCVSDSGDTSGFVYETDTFGGKIEGKEINEIVIISTVFLCAIRCSFVGRFFNVIVVRVFS